MSKLTIVVGGQYGSEAKGAITGFIAQQSEIKKRDVVGVRVGGPNAGHTVFGKCPPGCDLATHVPLPNGHEPSESHPWRLRQVPVSAVTAPSSRLIIAQGSEVDLGVLGAELHALDLAGYEASDRLLVDEQATVIEQGHKEAEQLNGLTSRVGSTAKGIGAARAGRIWRSAKTVSAELPAVRRVAAVEGTTGWLRMLLELKEVHVIIEGTQGFGLGLHAGHYPYSTSGDCRAIDFLAQAGVSPWGPGIREIEVVVCARTFPIRVAGNSGPMKNEMTWDQVGQPAERTTVTQKVRRVGAWDPKLVADAIRTNGGSSSQVVLALTMADYVVPEVYGHIGSRDPNLRNLVRWTEESIGNLAEIAYVGTSPVTVLSPGAVSILKKSTESVA